MAKLPAFLYNTLNTGILGLLIEILVWNWHNYIIFFFFKNHHSLPKLQIIWQIFWAADLNSAVRNAAIMFLSNSRGIQEMSKQTRGQNRNMWGNELFFFLGPGPWRSSSQILRRLSPLKLLALGQYKNEYWSSRFLLSFREIYSTHKN